MKRKEVERINGTVLWFDSSKRYGFILGEDGKDYFLYINDLDSNPLDAERKGVKCSFIPSENLKGLVALRVIIE